MSASGQPAPPDVRIEPALTPADVNAVRELFLEYSRMPGAEPCFASYLGLQGFDSEVATLPGVYAAPAGVLLLAWVNDHPAGCVALKPLEPPEVAEMKRLFVRASFRGLALGEHLARRVLGAARDAGYRRVRLDTLPSMSAALRLYARLGFHEIPAYNENPIAGAHFLEVELAVPAQGAAGPGSSR